MFINNEVRDMYYLIYKTTNKVNNMIYVGMHKTKNKNDGYLGSGIRLTEAVKTFGKENFQREILFECETEEEMLKREIEIVDEMFVARLDTYNVAIGGYGGWDYCNANHMNRGGVGFHQRMLENPLLEKEWKAKIGQSVKTHYADNPFSDEHRQKITNGLLLYFSTHPAIWTGRKHTNESKLAIGRHSAVHQVGSGNSQYGTMWIYNNDLKKSIKIHPDKLPEYLADGWIKGRKIKF